MRHTSLACGWKGVIGTALAIVLVAGSFALAPPASAAPVESGPVRAWGFNRQGQLGNGSTTDSAVPVGVIGSSQMVAIDAGSAHSLGLRTDGTVWAWGDNDRGQLGANGTADSSVPVQVTELTGATAVAAGGLHSLALKSDGTVWAWGYGIWGQLGNNSPADSLVPVQVTGLSGVKAISAGIFHSVALKSDGTVWAWGRNDVGQLGDNTTTDRPVPVQVQGNDLNGTSPVTSISAGRDHNIALRGDKTVWAWGLNRTGQLGDNSTTNRSLPVRVTGPGFIERFPLAVAGGADHSMALMTDGTVWTWGSNAFGQLGNGTRTSSSVPVQVSNLSGVSAIASGGNHSLVIKSDGTVREWGEGVVLPAQMSGVAGALAISGGASFSLVVTRPVAGPQRAWGRNHAGQHGTNSTTDSPAPVPVVNLDGAIAVTAGERHSLALRGDGTVWAWGANGAGQLGNNTSLDSSIPGPVNNLTGVKAIAAGQNHSLALKNDGTVWGWGISGAPGWLGTGPSNNNMPQQVSGLSGVTAIAAGLNHSLAVRSDGTAWAWGRNDFGQLGDISTDARTAPVQVTGLSGVSALAGGWYHSAALLSDGTVRTWGRAFEGQLGNNNPNDHRSIPVQVSNLNGVTAIAANGNHNLARMNNGTVKSWGHNAFGQLGNGANTNSAVPVLVSNLTGVTSVAAGWYHSLAVRSDGTVRTWGENDHGQLGTNSTTDSNVPVQPVLSPTMAVAGGGSHSLAVPLSLPGVPTLVSPIGDGITNLVTYKWSAVAGATEYQLWVNDPSGATVINHLWAASSTCSAGASTCDVTPVTTLGSGKHKWWVRAHNGAGYGTWSVSKVFTVVTPPGKPTLIAPTGNVSDTTPTYTWNAVSGAAEYELWVQARSTVVINSSHTAATAGCSGGTGTCSVTPTTALSPGSHTWWVRARNAAGSGTWSTGMVFTIVAPPAAPIPASPTGDVGDRTPTYTWHAVTTGATQYDLWVSDSSGTRVVNVQPTASAAGCSTDTRCDLTPTTSLVQGGHTWWVRARDAASWGAWSAAKTFTVLGAPTEQPELYEPSGNIGTDFPDYSWSSVYGAISYQLWVNEGSTTVVNRSLTASEAQCVGSSTCRAEQLNPALNSGRHTWWVRGVNDSGNGPWSTAMTFTVP